MTYTQSVKGSFLIIKKCWILQILFLYLLRYHMIFVSHPIDLIYYIKMYICWTSHASQINPTWLQYAIVLLCSWIWLANILRIFEVVFIKNIGPMLSFLVVSLSGFGIKVMLALKNEFGGVPSSSIFCKWEGFVFF